METLKINQTFKEFHNTQNDECPICGKKMVTLSPIVKLGNVAYCIEYYFDSQESKS